MRNDELSKVDAPEKTQKRGGHPSDHNISTAV